jgi:hypothetical protein
LPPEADIPCGGRHVRFVPKADITSASPFQNKEAANRGGLFFLNCPHIAAGGTTKGMQFG